jgi:hypothetical protein
VRGALTVHESLLVNTIGHAIGALIFGIFLLLLLGERMRSRGRANALSLLAASLALVWNVASLLVLAQRRLGQFETELLVAIATSALSLLPAVLLHLSFGRRFRPVVLAGYALSGAALAIHLSEVRRPSLDHHLLALDFTTYGFGGLTALSVAAILLSREGDRRSLTSRLVAAMSLFLFAISFVHLGAGEAHSQWTIELLVHHAGIPLALLVLSQDYRFLLFLAFLRRLEIV